ncbi:hypothetical protein H920_02827 [Fukomys damarensis]|uniref:Uncharacterized protein n=1 Tax=Fukomys damarensis TaxID=885580 RepID=A0A091DUH5_FUKDA|nr:hypothetical protein H920_02827 [Fukomys damarensis]
MVMSTVDMTPLALEGYRKGTCNDPTCRKPSVFTVTRGQLCIVIPHTDQDLKLSLHITPRSVFNENTTGSQFSDL